ncbi:SipW-dependent-type signal peptide-containing protein [Patescibacteria group bacterium]|nr:SipW-dependent-type signal peptide-containing protein [Patescibacteria group bacterium]
MKKIAISLGIIGVVAAIVIGATTAYFSDTETSTGNTLTAGVIDIVVDDLNPWEASFSEELKDMKPSYTRYIEFTVRNLEDSNPINLWKHINITEQSDGVITEPECDEGNGTWDQAGQTCIGEYKPRNNLAAYIIYDMYVCRDPLEQECETDVDGKPTTGRWEPIITEDQYVRLDNISSIWIYLGQLVPTKELKVVQSYHLRSWPGALEPEVTNWAQGDVLTFDIELMATQLNAPGPKGAQASLNMVGKDPTTWEEILDGSGILTYNTSGPTFNYNFSGTGLNNIKYCLIYYADPWPGNNPGALIASGTATANNLSLIGSYNFGYDLPNASDQNAPAGAKIWLVPCDDYDDTTKSMKAWSPSTYLFEENLIQYDDTDN